MKRTPPPWDDLQAAIDLLKHSGLVKLLEAAHSEPVERWPHRCLLMSAKEFDMVSDGEEHDFQWGPGQTGTALLTVLAAAAKVPELEAEVERLNESLLNVIRNAIAAGHARDDRVHFQPAEEAPYGD